MSEYSGKATRGMMVTLVFTMQAAGLIFGPVLAAILLRSSLSHDYVWRILLAVGAIPALAVFQMRRHLAETPRFLLAQGRSDEFTAAAHSVLRGPRTGTVWPASNQPAAAGAMASRTSAQAASPAARSGPERPAVKFSDGFRQLVSSPKLITRLVGASVAWFMMDFAYYGNTVSTPLVLAAISPKQSLLQHTLTQLVIFAAAALPGYLIAAVAMDRIGRKPIQTVGFGMMAVSFGAMALIPGIEKLVVPFLIIYGLSYFFTEFGPNATTFVYPAEIFPVQTRTTGHGVAAATGKIGGFAGVFLFPVLMSIHGLLAAESTAAIASLIGLGVTLAMLPETKRMSLEALSA